MTPEDVEVESQPCDSKLWLSSANPGKGKNVLQWFKIIQFITFLNYVGNNQGGNIT